MMKQQIEKVLGKVLKRENFQVNDRKSIFGEKQIAIEIFASTFEINNVKGQRPQMVSLLLDLNSKELRPQVFGGNGGQHIFRLPDMDNPKEKYLAMKSVKIPFRKPKNNDAAILNAIEKFATRWIETLKENRKVLKYQDIVDYDSFLN
ncbi:MAG: hypothetical protein ACOCVF_03115 [bacterium]